MQVSGLASIVTLDDAAWTPAVVTLGTSASLRAGSKCRALRRPGLRTAPVVVALPDPSRPFTVAQTAATLAQPAAAVDQPAAAAALALAAATIALAAATIALAAATIALAATALALAATALALAAATLAQLAATVALAAAALAQPAATVTRNRSRAGTCDSPTQSASLPLEPLTLLIRRA